MVQAEGTVQVTLETGREAYSEEPACCGLASRARPGRGGGGMRACEPEGGICLGRSEP